MNKHGLSYGIATVILWAMYNIIAKVSVTYGAHPAIFVSIGALSASAVLFQVAGKGRLSYETLKQPHTIFYSLLNMLEHLFTLYLFMYVAGTEGSLMQRMNVAMALFIAVAIMNRKPSTSELLGVGVILIGVALMIMGVEPDAKAPAMVWLSLTIFCQTVKTFIMETHPQSNDTKTFSEHARVTAFVTFVTAIVFLIVLLILAMIKSAGAIDSAIANVLPSLTDFVHPVTFIAGIVFGVLNEAASGYCYFYAARAMKAEKFLALTSLVPLVTFSMEYPLALANVIEVRDVTWRDAMAVSCILLGLFVMRYFKGKEIVKITTKEQRWHNHTRDIVMSALVHFNKDEDLTAEALGVKPATMQHILDKTKTFKKQTLNKINDNFAHNVMSRDPLTGLQNRLMFMTNAEKAIHQNVPFALIFIDLDKFKPVNDTYGHDAGDAVLKEIAERLRKGYQHIAEVTRLGGDEFCIMIYKAQESEVNSHIQEINRLVELPIDVESADEPVQVSASVGVAFYPDHAESLEGILKAADKNMYAEKKSDNKELQPAT